MCAESAGSSPGNAVWTNVALPPQSVAIAFAMSMSKPTGLPDVVFDSIGGKVGSSQNLNDVTFAGPAIATTATVAAARASAEARSVKRLIRSSFAAETLSVLRNRPEG